jgi:hypothetical protein
MATALAPAPTAARLAQWQLFGRLIVNLVKRCPDCAELAATKGRFR